MKKIKNEEKSTEIGEPIFITNEHGEKVKVIPVDTRRICIWDGKKVHTFSEEEVKLKAEKHGLTFPMVAFPPFLEEESEE